MIEELLQAIKRYTYESEQRIKTLEENVEKMATQQMMLTSIVLAMTEEQLDEVERK